MNKLDQKKKQSDLGNKTENSKSIIKVGDSEGSQKKENLIMNLMSEPSNMIPNKGRRKSIEVLMKDSHGASPNEGLERPTESNEQSMRLEKIPFSNKFQLSKHKKNKDGAPKDINLDHSFKSEYQSLIQTS